MSLFVYVIGPADSVGLLKIGKAVNVKQRLGQIKGMSPVPLAILWSHETEDLDLERKLHRHFASFRRHGEWFDFQEKDWRSLVQAAIEELESVTSAVQEPVEEPEHVPTIPKPRAVEVGPALTPLVWRRYQLTDGTPDWTLDESDAGATPRCLCGHKAARHADNAPHACAGELPWGKIFTLCDCPAFRGSSWWDPDTWQARALADPQEYSVTNRADESLPGWAFVPRIKLRLATQQGTGEPLLETTEGLGP